MDVAEAGVPNTLSDECVTTVADGETCFNYTGSITRFDKLGKNEALSQAVADVEILAPVPEPRQMRDGMSFPLHILQAPRGQLKLAARAKGERAESEEAA